VETTRLSTKGQVIIPKSLREALHWRPGQELEVIETSEGLLLRPKAPFKPTRLEDVAGMLKYDGPPLSDKDIQARLTESVRKQWLGRR
jgi:AbrB family looped-hinge helix DNA binding protein